MLKRILLGLVASAGLVGPLAAQDFPIGGFPVDFGGNTALGSVGPGGGVNVGTAPDVAYYAANGNVLSDGGAVAVKIGTVVTNTIQDSSLTSRLSWTTGNPTIVRDQNGAIEMSFSGGLVTDVASPGLSQSALLLSGAVNNTGTGTTNFPHLFIQPSGTSAFTSWNTAGLLIGTNVAGTYTGDLLGMIVGGVVELRATAAGVLIANSTIQSTVGNFTMAANGGQVNFRNGGTVLSSPASATLQFGTTDGATPVAQTIGVQNVAAGNANTAGVNFTEQGSLSTGTGAAGLININTGVAGVSFTGTATFTNSSGNIGLTAHGLPIGQAVQFTSTGTLPTNFALLTNYYVIASNYTANNINVSATPGGAAIIAGSAGSGTQTATAQTTVQNAAATLASFGPSSLTGSQATDLTQFKQLWNTSGTTNGFEIDISNVASNAGSNYFTVKGGTAGTVTEFAVQQGGGTIAPGGVLSGGSASGFSVAYNNGNFLDASSVGAFAWTNGNASGGTRDTTMCRFTTAGITQFGGSTCSGSGGIYASYLITGGGTPTLSGTCTTASQTGGQTAGTFTATCTAQTVIITFLLTAPNGWYCDAVDQTTVADTLKQNANSQTSCTLTGTTVAADRIVFQARAY